MAELLRAVDDEVGISYARFELLDTCGSMDGDDWEESGSLSVGLSEVEIRSDAGARHAAVRLEAWDEEPPPPGDMWIRKGEGVYPSVTGIVEMFGPEGRSGEKLLIGPPFFAYGLRAYSAPAAERDEHGKPVAEPWLLRFWPLCDAAGPVVGSESMTLGESGRRMTALLPLDLDRTDVEGDWPALRALPEPEPVLGWSTFTYEPLFGAGEDDEDELGIPDEDLRREARVDEILGDLRFELMGAPPQHLDSWSDEAVARYQLEFRADLRIAGELNPDGQPTLRLGAGDISLPFGGPWPGFSGRAWVWSSDGSAHPEALATDRQVITRDRILGRTLVTGIVTILREQSDRVEVRTATAAEAGRVLAAERFRT